jgi:hypothetical protein
MSDVIRDGPTGTPVDAPGPGGAPRLASEAKVLRAFFRDDRLVTIPARSRKRAIVLRYLLERCFKEDRPYPEKEVNQRLAVFHPDVAALRRYLVDDGLVTREAGLYRRA